MEKTKVKLFADRQFYHKLFIIMFPIALQSLMLSAVAAADAIMLGRIEQDSMAAVSLATQVQFIQNMITSAYTGAAAILGAQYYGKGDMRTINDIFCMSLRLMTGVSLLFFVLCFFFPEYLMMIFASDPVLIEIGAGYLKIAAWSYLITGFSQCYLTIMKVTGHPGTTALVSSCTVLLNIILNGILIFGLFGLTPMGAQGAALATLIARIVELAWGIAISYKKGYMHPDFSRFFVKNPQLSKDFRKCYLP
nr:polysaccharide biosynthesis C-terminal domain-containing protein [Lachnospiraceae bacterium]